METIISIQDLLLWGHRSPELEQAVNNHQRVLLVRHKKDQKEHDFDGDKFNGTLKELYRKDKNRFYKYQNEQATKDFDNVDYIVSFIGEESDLARFIGVFKNNGIKRKSARKECSIFAFDKLSGFEPLEEKVIVAFSNPRVWKQNWDNTKFVVRIDNGFAEKVPPFISYDEVKLSYQQLRDIIQSDNGEWRAKLEACNCVYLILDKTNGKQYVGVTYNNKKDTDKGIWKRWKEYAADGYGGDKDLEKLCKNDPKRTYQFQLCILETLPINVTQKVAQQREKLYKQKIGTGKPWGYNNN